MTTLPADHPFRRLSANLVAVKKGLVQLERIHRSAIRRGDWAALDTICRFHMLAVGLMAEARLRKIIWDPDGFNERERELLRRTLSQQERWQAAVEYAFRRHYAVPIHRELDQFILGVVPFGQLQTVLGLLDAHLSAVIGDRNKTAHAQWIWHMNSRETAIVGPAPNPLNYLAIKALSDLIERIGDLVHVLAVSEPTFQRDFDAISTEIGQLAQNVDGSGYGEYVVELQRTRLRVSYKPQGESNTEEA